MPLTGLSIPNSQTTMPNMSLLELLFALLLVCVLAGTGGVAALAWSLVRRADGQAVAVEELRRQLHTRCRGREHPRRGLEAPAARDASAQCLGGGQGGRAGPAATRRQAAP